MRVGSPAEGRRPIPKQVTNVAADDALTSIYRLAHDEDEVVIAARVAERLGLKAASVASMIGRLKRDGLVRVDEKKRISLSPTGRARAEQMVRRHRLAECLLVDVIGLPWWRAYEEAHLMEHSISEVTEPLIVERLGRPALSPFGYPMPGGADERPISHRRLSSLAVGATTSVERVYEESEDLLRFFDEQGIRPRVELIVTDVAPFRGTVTLAVNGNELVIGTEAAARIWVPEGA